MKQYIYFLLIVVTMLPLVGCGSFTVHYRAPMSCQVGDPRYEALTPIYGGVANDYDAMMDCLKAPIPGVEKKEHSDEWWLFFLLPLPIIDMPLSFIFDTIELPRDIGFWSEWSANKKAKKKLH